MALVATAIFASSASTASAVTFGFIYDNGYGDHGLSQPYAGTTTTGQSYGTSVAIEARDTSQNVYSLVEATCNIGVGGARGAFSAASRTISATASTPNCPGPYSILRGTSDGNIDATFGGDGAPIVTSPSPTAGAYGRLPPGSGSAATGKILTSARATAAGYAGIPGSSAVQDGVGTFAQRGLLSVLQQICSKSEKGTSSWFVTRSPAPSCPSQND